MIYLFIGMIIGVILKSLFNKLMISSKLKIINRREFEEIWELGSDYGYNVNEDSKVAVNRKWDELTNL